MKTSVYLDNNATTRVDDQVLQAMIPFFTEHYANPSGLYKAGKIAKDAVEGSREMVAELVNAKPKEIIFVGCGTEADNTALWSAIKCQPYKKHIIVSSCEHPAVSKVAEVLKQQGYEVTKVLPNQQGIISPDQIARALRPDTALVSIMWANNETGVVQPVEEIGKVAKQGGAFYHIDATQAVGKVPVNFQRSLADYLVFSAHKIHGPKGVGVLVVREGVCYQPLLLGGAQENKCRAGTENVPGIVGTGMATKLAAQNILVLFRDVAPLRDWLQVQLKNIFGADLMILGESAPRTPNTLMVAIRDANGRQIQEFLSQRDIVVGTGSACSCLKKSTPSDTIVSMQVPEDFQRGTVRISLSKYNSPQYGGRQDDLLPLLHALTIWRQAQLLRRKARQ